MSEFKYACPVCGQHMVCDSSQSGTVMECPTCFQKIVAPQAPTTNDPKFILTGTKYVEKKIPDSLTQAARGVTVKESNPMLAVVAFLVVLVLAAGAAVFMFRDKIFNSGGSHASDNPPAVATTSPSSSEQPVAPVKPVKVVKAPPVAPQATDNNWMLTLDGVTNFPSAPVAGRIHGMNFIIERAYFQNGILSLRAGTHGPMEFGCTINFGGAQAEALSGQSINVSTDAETAARVVLRWKSDADSGKDNFDTGYAMRLEFDKLDKSHLPGKIYLCTPDAEKSYLIGTFSADARKPKPKK